MSAHPKVAIIGAGFSGLTLAWHLQKQGCTVEIFEKQNRSGGLIDTSLEPMMVESAAHALLANSEVEQLFKELNLEICPAGYKSNKKWIFRGNPQKWPLDILTSAKAVFKFLFKQLTFNVLPKAKESVKDWCSRVFNEEFNDFLLAPALQGVYGSQTDHLSAALIVGGMFAKDLRVRRGRYRGSVAPERGMQQLIQALASQLKIHYSSDVRLADLQKNFSAVVIATSSPAAAQIISAIAPILSHHLSQLDTVGLVSATVYLQETSQRINGFGCLFPKKENFNSLGVLFNNDIFKGRGPLENETWIFTDTVNMSTDAQILEKIKQDRHRLCDENISIMSFKIMRWPQVLPLYGFKLENLLLSDAFDVQAKNSQFPHLNVLRGGAKSRESKFPLYFTGNYLGGIGLSKILSYNSRLALRIVTEIGDKS